MDYLPDVVFKDILEKLIALISNPKIGFPSGSLSRSVICYKIIDVMVVVSLRIGFEMTRKMMTTLLKRFFRVLRYRSFQRRCRSSDQSNLAANSVHRSIHVCRDYERFGDARVDRRNSLQFEASVGHDPEQPVAHREFQSEAHSIF